MMKKYTVYLENSVKVSLECAAPHPGSQGHDLVCKNEAGDTIAYFYTFLYWIENPIDMRTPLSAAK